MGDVRVQAFTLEPRDAGPSTPKRRPATKQFVATLISTLGALIHFVFNL